jgi:hypothetical protein
VVAADAAFCGQFDDLISSPSCPFRKAAIPGRDRSRGVTLISRNLGRFTDS